MPSSRQAEAERLARAAVNAAMRSIYDRQTFTIEKFGRHPDGYYHARVRIGEQAYYLHLKYGSWLVPGHIKGRPVLKEPEALLGPIGSEVKYALSEKWFPIYQAEMRDKAHQEQEAKRNARRFEDTSGTGEAGAGHGVPEAGDPGDAPDEA